MPPPSTDAPGVVPAPFGPGATVQVTSGGKPVSIFVARIEQGAVLPLPDSAFVKVGKTPVAFQLPPGSYQLEAQGFELSNESMLLEMKNDPKRLLVRPGSEGMSTTGTLLLAAGVVGIVGATAILLSGSKAPSSFHKSNVLIPMYAAGGVLFGAGLGLYLAGQTKIDDQRSPAPTPQGRGALLRLGVRF